MTNALLKGHLMKRGTIMVLKRFVLVALGPLGLSALLVGPASADIPPPNLLKDVAECIAAHAPARPASIKPLTAPPAVVAPATGTMITPPAAMAASDPVVQTAKVLFTAKAMTCAYNAAGALIDINLAGQIASAGTQLAALNPESADYQTELDALLETYSGPIFDALVLEATARRATERQAKGYNDARTDFLLAARAQKMDADGVAGYECRWTTRYLKTPVRNARGYQALTYGVENDDRYNGGRR